MPQARANLSQIIGAIEIVDDLSQAFFDRQTGEMHIVSDEDIAAAEDEQVAARSPDWQQPIIEIARLIEADPGDRFAPLPSQFDAHEWEPDDGTQP